MNAVRRCASTLVLTILAGGTLSRADWVEYSFEGDVLLTDPSAGWSSGDPCVLPCTQSAESGHFVIMWDEGVRRVNYSHSITEPPDPPLPSLWVEWNFASNHPFPASGRSSCDATFIVRYIYESVFVRMFGDAAMSFGVVEFRGGLEIDEFHTYRYENRDGVQSRVYVDGELLFTRHGTFQNTGPHNVQIGGEGGCTLDAQPTFNRYDYVRYGTISFGEQIIASDPPAGVVGSAERPGFDRFTVAFDSPNYVLIDEVAVNVAQAREARSDGTFPDGSASAAAAGALQVIKTRRPVNGPPDTVEIVLDGPLPLNATTTFTFDDGVATNVVEYTYVETGACCLDDGTCEILGEAECMAQGGFFASGEPCGDPTACCFNGACEELPAVCCNALGGDPPQSPLGKGGGCEGDVDADGVDALCGDACPADPFKTTPGQCGCGVSDVDSDNDTVPDCLDQCPGEDDNLDEDGNNVPDCLQFQPIPTTTAWGLAVLALVLLIAAKLRLPGLERGRFAAVSAPGRDGDAGC